MLPVWPLQVLPSIKVSMYDTIVTIVALDLYDHNEPSFEELEVTETKELTETNPGEPEGVPIQD